jgi:hypothetical protein
MAFLGMKMFFYVWGTSEKESQRTAAEGKWLSGEELGRFVA